MTIENDTPETDGEWNRLACLENPEFEQRIADFARRLERERDEARAGEESETKWAAQYKAERDEARKPPSVWLVFGEHNRYGEWLAGAYTNEDEANAHKAHLDATKDGWKNYCGGEVRKIVTASKFSAPERNGADVAPK